MRGPSLADVLRATPPTESGVTIETVSAVLRSISLAEAGVAVLADGRFQLGPLTGRFAKPAAEFIGSTAREDRRRRLLTDLDARIGEVSARMTEVGQDGLPGWLSGSGSTRWPRPPLPSSRS